MEPFASYLARRHVTDKGFVVGLPDIAAPLSEHADLALTYGDGYAFSMLCIVDAEEDASKRWPIEVERLVEIGKGCLEFTGRMNGTKLPVGIQIIEVRSSITEEDRARLKALQRVPGLAKVGVTAMILVPATGEAWSSAPLGFLRQREMRKLMTEPRVEPGDEPGPVAATGAGGRPVVTCAMLAVLALAFAAQHLYAVGPGQPGSLSVLAEAKGLLGSSVPTLITLGGLRGELTVGAGEWHRVLTATLLHGDLFHLALNGVALFLGAALLESFVGRAWLVPLFLAGALGGSLASLMWNSEAAVGVGASGAIMGLLAGALVLTYRLPARDRAPLTMPLMQMLVPSLIPLATHRSSGKVDFAAHLGGALAGAVAGAILLRLWPRDRPTPRFGRAALTLTGVGVMLYAFAIWQAALLRPTYEGAFQGEFLTKDDFDKKFASQPVSELISRFPEDPYVYYLAALQPQDDGGTKEREAYLRQGLSKQGALRLHYPDRKLDVEMRRMLAVMLTNQGRAAEATEVARPACDVGSRDLAPFCR
ncbi:rhomboid family intramembrane serine protease [Chondromyces crocatus]|uniref:Peptidase S54 rhomboid domain-containing protein n=1 Tax=Chondromyces crocatus TaxID=52 RepID=A0A0K1EEQ3_CHOCO|nr:rhomboid family intramembrane serine protease [Chondromyces crocatus]AKT39162.1 uncharacterized protein CMC5_033090 [Chondromyces crocatus]